MISVLIAFAFGVLEAFVLSKILFAVTSGDYVKAIIFMLIKFATYAVAIALLLLFFSQCIINCAIGYSVGLPIVTIVWFAHKISHGKGVKSGDDQNEHNNNN